MCLEPSKIANVGFVACRKCRLCLDNRVNDWIGRNVAESKTASASHVVTLTYGDTDRYGETDNIRAAVLTYSDVQKFLKYLRADGFPVRYFAVGEYGSLKGRAHWHVILYWQGPVPEHVLRENFAQKHWPHGWSYWDEMSPSAVRYACKYLLKDPKDPAKQGYGPIVSRYPPLGDAYFKQLAARYVDEGLCPQDLLYSFPDVRRLPYGSRGKSVGDLMAKAKPTKFKMGRHTADNFLEEFGRLWEQAYGDAPPACKPYWDWQARKVREYLASVQLPQFLGRVRVATPLSPPPGGSEVRWDERVHAFHSDVDGKRMWFSHDTEGEAQWHEKVRPDPARRLHQEQHRELVKRGHQLSEYATVSQSRTRSRGRVQNSERGT